MGHNKNYDWSVARDEGLLGRRKNGMYNENHLTLDDEMELEDAGLDVDELADMDWDDRYDAIDEAGLNPMDYEYGFLNDEYPEESASVSKAKEETPKREKLSRSRAPKIRVKRMGRRERRKFQKAYDDLETTLDALWGCRL